MKPAARRTRPWSSISSRPAANCSTSPPFWIASIAARTPARWPPTIRASRKSARPWKCCTTNRAAERSASSRFFRWNTIRRGRSRSRGIDRKIRLSIDFHVYGRWNMTVTIPDSFRDFVSAQIASGHYADENALVCALLEKEQAKMERDTIDMKLLESLDGSPATEMIRADWDEMCAEVQRRHAQRNGSHA